MTFNAITYKELYGEFKPETEIGFDISMIVLCFLNHVRNEEYKFDNPTQQILNEGE